MSNLKNRVYFSKRIKLEILKEAAKLKAEAPLADPDFKMPEMNKQ